MRRVQKGGFDRHNAEIWQFSPFQPNHEVADFVNQFHQAGEFDAERFWEFVTTGAKQVQLRKQPGRESLKPGWNRYLGSS